MAVNPSTVTADNAMYDAVSYYLASTLPLSGVARVYDDIQAYTGWSIRYPMVDSRLIPFSGQNTGIFYAPADLTGRVIGAGGEPTSYFTVSVVGSDGNTYAAGQLPAGVTAVNYNINYTDAFYNTMIYHTYFGYDGQEVGQVAGIPWLSSTNSQGASDPIEPGWMLEHFQVVYRTAYSCPTPNATAGSPCFMATNVPTAEKVQSKLNGTADLSLNSYFGGGEAILQYYPGVTAVGTVELPNGRPVSDARVTVYDSWGIPHMTTLTGSDGSYSLILPPGEDTVNVSTGSVNLLTQAGATHLTTFNVTVPAAYGLSLNSPTMLLPLVVKPATVQGFLTWSTSGNSGSTNPVVGATVVFWGHNLSKLTATTDASGTFGISNVPPGVYNVSIVYRGSNYTESTASALPGKTVNETESLSSGEIFGTVRLGDGAAAPGVTVSVAGNSGLAATATTNATGRYHIDDLGPGNYTVHAATTSPRQSSNPQSARLATPGANTTLNFTIVPVAPVSVEVLAGGTPVSGIPVRFTQILPPVISIGPTNNTTSAHLTQQQANTSVAMTNVDGVASLVLPEGNYSVYALGYNGSSYRAGFWSGPVGPGSTTVPALALSSASRLYGYANGTANASISLPIEVSAYDASGHVVWAFSNSTRQYLPLASRWDVLRARVEPEPRPVRPREGRGLRTDPGRPRHLTDRALDGGRAQQRHRPAVEGRDGELHPHEPGLDRDRRIERPRQRVRHPADHADRILRGGHPDVLRERDGPGVRAERPVPRFGGFPAGRDRGPIGRSAGRGNDRPHGRSDRDVGAREPHGDLGGSA